jgi:triosephosphate isomerase
MARNKDAAEGRKPLMAANWKMNLNHLEAIALVQKLSFSFTDRDLDLTEAVVLPPFTSIRSVQTVIEGDRVRIGYGAQDLSQHDAGAYTGEISGAMLAKLGCTYVIVGHSERRQYHHEDDALVNAKVRAAFRHGLVPLMCVGEGLDVRRAGDHVRHTLAQVDGGLAGIPAAQARNVVIAYEPVWAIGTGEVATPDDAQEVCGAIRERMGELYPGELADGVRVLYGGSVKGSNIAGIMARPDIDGALIGGAGLDPEDFVRIVRFRDQPAA